MAPIVADNAVRVAINGVVSGNPFANVFGGFITGSGTPLGLAQDIGQSYVDNLLPLLCNNVHVDNVSYVDLRTLDGDSGVVATGISGPFDGGNTEPQAPMQVCWLLHWAVGGGRNSRNGRTYLPGVAETSVDESGHISGDLTTDLPDAVNAFLADITGGDNGDLGVLSNPSTGEPQMRSVISGSVDALVATQRRRLRR